MYGLLLLLPAAAVSILSSDLWGGGGGSVLTQQDVRSNQRWWPLSRDLTDHLWYPAHRRTWKDGNQWSRSRLRNQRLTSYWVQMASSQENLKWEFAGLAKICNFTSASVCGQHLVIQMSKYRSEFQRWESRTSIVLHSSFLHSMPVHWIRQLIQGCRIHFCCCWVYNHAFKMRGSRGE